jgi:hypothetical protein
MGGGGGGLGRRSGGLHVAIWVVAVFKNAESHVGVLDFSEREACSSGVKREGERGETGPVEGTEGTPLAELGDSRTSELGALRAKESCLPSRSRNKNPGRPSRRLCSKWGWFKREGEPASKHGGVIFVIMQRERRTSERSISRGANSQRKSERAN